MNTNPELSDRLDAHKTARRFGFTSAEAVNRLFPGAVVEFAENYAAGYLTPLYELENHVSSWRRVDDVPRGLFRELTPEGRSWFAQRIRNMMRSNWLRPAPMPEQRDTHAALFRRLWIASGAQQPNPELARRIRTLAVRVMKHRLSYDLACLYAVQAANEQSQNMLGGAVAGMSKMPVHKPLGRKEEPRAADCTGARAARGTNISEE